MSTIDRKRPTNRAGEETVERQQETGLTREKERRDRVPRHKQRALDFQDKDPNFHYRVVNDTPGKIASYLRAGWELVEGNNLSTFSGDGRAEASQAGSAITRVVNKDNAAQAKIGYLMRIPIELFEEDKLGKRRRNQQVIESVDPAGELQRALAMGSRTNIRLKKDK